MLRKIKNVIIIIVMYIYNKNIYHFRARKQFTFFLKVNNKKTFS